MWLSNNILSLQITGRNVPVIFKERDDNLDKEGTKAVYQAGVPAAPGPQVTSSLLSGIINPPIPSILAEK